MREEGKRLTQIIECLFIPACADAEQFPLRKRDFYPNALLTEIYRAARILIAKNNLKFKLKTENELLFNGDETLIRRLNMNLLANPIKYTPPNDEISFWCDSTNENYEIRVCSTGEVIPFEAQTKIFERLYRADKVRSRVNSEKGAGAGPGFSIGRWIAKAHSGNLELIESNRAQTVFVVILHFSIAVE